MVQMTIFDVVAHVRSSDPATSREAAEKIQSVANRQAMAVWAVFAGMGGPATSWEISERAQHLQYWDLNYHAIARRLPDLEVNGRVRRTNLKRDGRMVWECIKECIK